MKWLKKAVVAALAVALCATSVITLAACNKTPTDSIELTRPTAEDENKVTYNTFTTVMPSNWNIMTYQDNNDSQIMDYIYSSFFEYDYKFDSAKGGKFKDGKVNAAAIIKDDFDVKFSAATNLEDVTATAPARYGYTEEQKEEGGYAWKLTLRNDLKWDDGTAIKADDFIWSMQQQLDPAYQHYRASTYFGAVNLIGAKEYVYQGQSGTGFAVNFGKGYEADKSTLKFNLQGMVDYYAENGRTVTPITFIISKTIEALNTEEKAQAFYDAWKDKPIADCLADTGTMKEFLEDWMGASLSDCDFTKDSDYYDDGQRYGLAYLCSVDYVYPEVGFETVGLYKDGDYGVVVCFTESKAFRKKDNDGHFTGDLSYLAAYEMSSLPLAHKAKYEASKIPAASTSALPTTNYNTTLESSASWGPYKLVQFQGGKSYTLEKNPNWYGYNMDDNQDQYLVDKIYCEKLEQTNTQWMAFLGGCVDDIGIDVTHSDDYRASKYAYTTPGSYTFSWHLLGDLGKLKASGRNNGILAIQDFRKALSLAIDRDEYARRLTTAYQAGYGYLNDMYYYDVVNNGIYRKTEQGKKALLRAYGYTESADGKWSLPGNAAVTNVTLDAAYATLSGYNLTQAKQLIESAYTKLTANAEKYGYDPSKKIQIKFGTSADNDSTRREFNLVNEILTKVTQGTSLEGKVEAVFDASFESKWADEFIAGNYELCTSAWGSATFNPCYLIGAYIEPASAFTAGYFDVKKETLEIPTWDDENDQMAATKETVTYYEAYARLNGLNDASKNWATGQVTEEFRLEVLAALEENLLCKYYSIPTITQFSSTLLGAKFEYINDNYNTFMSYGGMRYIRPQYTNLEWYNYVVDTMKRDLSSEYKKTAE